jgi:hypothetical protein
MHDRVIEKMSECPGAKSSSHSQAGDYPVENFPPSGEEPRISTESQIINYYSNMTTESSPVDESRGRVDTSSTGNTPASANQWGIRKWRTSVSSESFDPSVTSPHRLQSLETPRKTPSSREVEIDLGQKPVVQLDHKTIELSQEDLQRSSKELKPERSREPQKTVDTEDDERGPLSLTREVRTESVGYEPTSSGRALLMSYRKPDVAQSSKQ